MAGRVFLARHGETEWSAAGRHTSSTDLDLTPAGEEAARSLLPLLQEHQFVRVLVSPALRARRTAELAGFGLAGFASATVDDDLVEWDYGDYEGATTDEIRTTVPDWTIWTHPVPGGESAAQVGERLDRVVARARSVEGDTLLFGHGHALRALVARWLGRPVEDGRFYRLDTATVSVLGHEREVPVLLRWNVPS